MSSIPKNKKSKYNKNNPYAWVDSQWEKFMTEQKELKAKILKLTMENSELKDEVERLGGQPDTEERSDEWRISQYNRNRDMEDQVSTIDEMEERVSEQFEDPRYVYETPDGGKTMYRRKLGDYDNKEQVDKDGIPFPVQLELFDASSGC